MNSDFDSVTHRCRTVPLTTVLVASAVIVLVLPLAALSAERTVLCEEFTNVF